MTDTMLYDVPTTLMPALLDQEAATADRSFWQTATVGSLIEAERLLDQSEAQGYRERSLVVCKRNLFIVRWR